MLTYRERILIFSLQLVPESPSVSKVWVAARSELRVHGVQRRCFMARVLCRSARQSQQYGVTLGAPFTVDQCGSLLAFSLSSSPFSASCPSVSFAESPVLPADGHCLYRHRTQWLTALKVPFSLNCERAPERASVPTLAWPPSFFFEISFAVTRACTSCTHVFVSTRCTYNVQSMRPHRHATRSWIYLLVKSL